MRGSMMRLPGLRAPRPPGLPRISASRVRIGGVMGGTALAGTKDLFKNRAGGVYATPETSLEKPGASGPSVVPSYDTEEARKGT